MSELLTVGSIENIAQGNLPDNFNVQVYINKILERMLF